MISYYKFSHTTTIYPPTMLLKHIWTGYGIIKRFVSEKNSLANWDFPLRSRLGRRGHIYTQASVCRETEKAWVFVKFNSAVSKCRGWSLKCPSQTVFTLLTSFPKPFSVKIHCLHSYSHNKDCIFHLQSNSLCRK